MYYLENPCAYYALETTKVNRDFIGRYRKLRNQPLAWILRGDPFNPA
jgi:hypothetical protein